VGFPTGLILVVKHNNYYGAVLAVEQASMERGACIRYIWWYQPDGSRHFVGPGTQTGYGEAREDHSRPGPSPRLSPDYLLALTNKVDISQVDATKVNLLGPARINPRKKV
jgi:hypothetical protein